MTEAVAAAAVSFAVGIAAMLASIFVFRVLGSRRRRLERRLRPNFERAIGAYLADDETAMPVAPAGKSARRVFRAVALDALIEVRGRERDRLTSLLEETGIARDTAEELRSRRRLVRRRAADALGEIRSPATADALATGLSDPDREVRVACARALAELREERFLPRIVAAAEEAVSARPGHVAEVMLALGAGIPATLGEALRSTRSPELRLLAAAVVGELRLAEHAPLLREALSGDDELAARAARGLGLIGDADAVGPLVAIVEDEGRASFLRAVAAKALGAIGDPRGTRALERQLHSDSWSIARNAAHALSMLGTAGHDALRLGLESERAETRGHAAVALEA